MQLELASVEDEAHRIGGVHWRNLRIPTYTVPYEQPVMYLRENWKIELGKLSNYQEYKAAAQTDTRHVWGGELADPSFNAVEQRCYKFIGSNSLALGPT